MEFIEHFFPQKHKTEKNHREINFNPQNTSYINGVTSFKANDIHTKED